MRKTIGEYGYESAKLIWRKISWFDDSKDEKYAFFPFYMNIYEPPGMCVLQKWLSSQKMESITLDNMQ